MNNNNNDLQSDLYATNNGDTDTAGNFKERVQELVSRIPAGRLMTYGQLAALCGSPRAARIVGGVAHYGDPNLPWHRVVNKQGGLASGYPGGRAAHAEALRAEGILVTTDMTVDVQLLLWWPSNGYTDGGRNIPPLIVILGQTAAGKSELALQLAERLGGEIICADSWTVYKEFDIGTAKPTAAERARAPHHLLDIADPAVGFSAALFKDMAKQRIAEVAARGKVPILVGGTGLYIDSVLYDYEFLPAPAPHVRQELSKLSIPELLTRAMTLELDTSGIDTGNKRRIIRLIENNGQLPNKSELRPNTLVLGLQLQKDQLELRVTKRVDDMLSAGLEREVQTLANKYGWNAEPMKGIGYREFKPYYEGVNSYADTRNAIIHNTMALAKKQNTWFKRNKSIHWLTTDDKTAEAVDYATTLLNK